MKDSKIQWTNDTGGPHLGCSEVSPGCLNCYARELALTRHQGIFRKAYKAAGFEDWETRPVWGVKATRVITKGFWKDALAADRRAGASGRRTRWFPSLIDWLDDMPAGVIGQEGQKLNPDQLLLDFLTVVAACKNLDFLLLTKRPENWRARISAALAAGDAIEDAAIHGVLIDWLSGRAPENVWVGTSIEDQDRLRRHSFLMQIPAKIRFWSAEPLLGPLACGFAWSVYGAPDWVIVGGESGPGSRPMHPQWATSIRDECVAANVPFFFKQWGEFISGSPGDAKLPLDRPPDHCWQDAGDVAAFRVGKIAAGRELDGRTWDQFPRGAQV